MLLPFGFILCKINCCYEYKSSYTKLNRDVSVVNYQQCYEIMSVTHNVNAEMNYYLLMIFYKYLVHIYLHHMPNWSCHIIVEVEETDIYIYTVPHIIDNSNAVEMYMP
jgi:hypothetical protein